MKKEIGNKTSLIFLLLIAACFPTHNDVYKQNINRKRLTSAQVLTTIRKGSASIRTYCSNHDASYKLLISGDIKLKPGPNNGNRIGNQRDANVRAPKCNICYETVRIHSKGLMCEY